MLVRLLGEHVRLALVLAPDLGSVRADRSQLEQVILNLALNARDAMPDGGELRIETSNALRPRDGGGEPAPHVQLRVQDTGTGMDAKAQAHLFEPFFTTKEVGRGTGLGLATVYGILRQSGGQVVVRSELGLGTTFDIWLPLVDAKPDALARLAEPSESASGTETVLVVEDEEAVLALMRHALNADGYRVLVARNGVEALEIFRSRSSRIDLVVTDVIMPRMSGSALAQHLKADGLEAKILFVSGHADEALTRHGITVGQNVHFLAKPMTGNDLVRRVRDVLGPRGGAPAGTGTSSPP
jgi:two-component system cell cycle sensor histidine kinase/response regulator CckA